MSDRRRKEVKRHLTEDELDEVLAEADDDEIVRRLVFIKNLYREDTVEEAAERVGRSESTGDRWTERWNEGGLDGLPPSFGGGRPPKLDDQEQRELLELLREGQPWKPREIQRLLNEEFGVEYHPSYLSDFLRSLGLSYSIPRTRRSSRLDDAEEVLDGQTDEPHNRRENDREGGWELDDDICTDGGTVVGFSDASHPQP